MGKGRVNVKTIKKIVFLFLVMSLFPLAVGFVSNRLAPVLHSRAQQFFGEDWQVSLEFWKSGQNLVVFLTIAIIVSLVVIVHKKGFLQRSRFRAPKPKEIFLALTIGVASALLLSGVGRFALRAFPEYADFFQSRFEHIAEHRSLPLIVALVVVAPFFEEILFRGVLFRLFEKEKISLGIALVFTSFLFALYHADFFEGAYAFTLGLIIGLAYIFSKSLWVAMLLHYAHNIAAPFISIDFDFVPFELYTAAGGLLIIIALSALYRQNKSMHISP